MDYAYKTIRRIVIAVIGGTVLLLGIAMLVLPGPAVIVIPAGLAILAMEFAWAKHWLHKAREAFEKGTNVFRGNKKPEPKASEASTEMRG